RDPESEERARAESDSPDEREQCQEDEHAARPASGVRSPFEAHGPGGGASAGEIGTGVASRTSSTTALAVTPERRARGSRRIRWSRTAWGARFPASGRAKGRARASEHG